MRCLVTGGAGFIGSNLVDSLVEGGHEVTVVDDESAESNDQFYWREDTNNYKVDVSGFPMAGGELIRVFQNHSPQIIFHLAAFARIPLGIKNPVKACTVNTMGTCNLLQLAREFDVKRFIFSSTSSVYGLKNEPPLKEDYPRDCLNPYSVTKAAAEDLCQMYTSLYGLETVIFRYFNVYGERQPAGGQYAPVIGIFQKQAREGKAMTITGDGEQRRDFTYVKDVVEANMLALTPQNEKAIGEIFNIGAGNNYSVNEIADMIGGGRSYIDAREGEARVTLADISKARDILGWEPRVKVQEWVRNQK